MTLPRAGSQSGSFIGYEQAYDEADDSEEVTDTGNLTDEGPRPSHLMVSEPEEQRGYHSETSAREQPRLPPAFRHACEGSNTTHGSFGFRRNKVATATAGLRTATMSLQTPLLDRNSAERQERQEGEAGGARIDSDEASSISASRQRRGIPQKRLPPARRQLKGSAQAGIRSPTGSPKTTSNGGDLSAVPPMNFLSPVAGSPHVSTRDGLAGTFTLPPLRSGSSSQDATRLKRCTSYCCGMSLELEALFRPLQVCTVGVKRRLVTAGAAVTPSVVVAAGAMAGVTACATAGVTGRCNSGTYDRRYDCRAGGCNGRATARRAYRHTL